MKISPGRFTVGRLMIVIALLAALLAAGIYRWNNADVDRATIHADLWAMTRGDAEARRRATEALGEARATGDARVRSALMGAALGDRVPAVREAAVQSLGQVLAALYHAKKVPAKKAGPPPPQPPLGASAEEASAVQVIVRAMTDAQPEVRRAAAEAFHRLQDGIQVMPRLAAAAVAALERLLEDLDPATRIAAVRGLGRMNPPPSLLRDRLIALMEHDPDATVRGAAIGSLVARWPSAELYPILLNQYVKARTADERAAICYALTGLPPPLPALVPVLVGMLEGGEQGPAYHIPPILFKLDGGEQARPLLGAVRQAVIREVAEREGGQRGLPFPFALTLATLDPDSPEAQALLGPLGRLFRDTPNTNERYYLSQVLAAYHQSAAPLVSVLRGMLRSPDSDARHQAALLLGGIGPSALEAIDDLEALPEHEHDFQVDQLIRTLRRLRPR